MKRAFLLVTSSVLTALGALAADDVSPADASAQLPAHRSGARLIDLPTALRLAGARNLEVRMAAENAAIAAAGHASARQQLYPWFTVGAGFRRHWGNVQTSDGFIIDADKSSLDLALGVQARLDFGEARYKALAASQLAQAAQFASEIQRQDSVLAAAGAYFDLVRAQAVVLATDESAQASNAYADQVVSAVEAGIAFKGDASRARAQAGQDRVVALQAEEQARIAAARLAARLHLDSGVTLVAIDELPAPLSLVPLDRAASAWMGQALGKRPELDVSEARREAARIEREAARFGPLYPTLNVAGGIGGLAGAPGGSLDSFDTTGDFALMLAWRVGPGGLLDKPRSEAAAARERAAALQDAQVRETILLQVTEALARVQSLARQIEASGRALEASEETVQLSLARREFAVGVVAETLLATQDAAKARRSHVALVAEFNKAQFLLRRAAGESSE